MGQLGQDSHALGKGLRDAADTARRCRAACGPAAPPAVLAGSHPWVLFPLGISYSLESAAPMAGVVARAFLECVAVLLLALTPLVELGSSISPSRTGGILFCLSWWDLAGLLFPRS